MEDEKEVKEEVEEEEEEDDYECNGFLQMPEMDLSIELPTAAEMLGYDDEE